MTGSRFSAYRDSAASLHWSWPGATLDFPPPIPYVAGILNVTPDSFSDGGSYASPGQATAHAWAMAEAGAAIVDVGGQSTRPGSAPVSLREEEERTLPALKALKEMFSEGVPGGRILISLDTDKPALAEKVFDLGLADILNDESGGDPAMARIAARYGAPLILMHRPATPTGSDFAAVREGLAYLRQLYMDAGLPKEHIALDPGLGFGKGVDGDMVILSRLGELLELGGPLYIGASRKGFIGRFSGNPDPGRRLGGSLAAALWAASAGAAFLRVHDVRETVEALTMAAALRNRIVGG